MWHKTGRKAEARICMHVLVHTHTWTHAHTCTHACTHVRTQARHHIPHTHMYTRMHARTQTHDDTIYCAGIALHDKNYDNMLVNYLILLQTHIFTTINNDLLLVNQSTEYASQHIWSQARINWEDCARKGIWYKNGGDGRYGGTN